MKLINLFRAFNRNDSVAATIDWPVLTAAIVDFGMVVMTQVGGSITGLGDAIVTDLGSRHPGFESQP